jgi:hypothetical protein
VTSLWLKNEDQRLTSVPFLAEIGSEAFQKFLNLLGDTITLKGWTGYRGGLDTKSKHSPCQN